MPIDIDAKDVVISNYAILPVSLEDLRPEKGPKVYPFPFLVHVP
jgi:hypothetical protein